MAIPIFATLTACASAGNTAANSEPSYFAQGTYQFVATVPGQHLLGTMRVDADTMIVDIENRDCRGITAPRQSQQRTEVFRFGCTGGLLFTFDRRNPVRSLDVDGVGSGASSPPGVRGKGRSRRARSVHTTGV